MVFFSPEDFPGSACSGRSYLLFAPDRNGGHRHFIVFPDFGTWANLDDPLGDQTVPENIMKKGSGTVNNLRRRAVILTADRFEDLEVLVPYFRMLEMGWETVIAAPALEPIHGEHRYRIEPDLTIDAVNPEDYDLLIIPGGSPAGAPATVRNLKKAQDIVRSFFAGNKPVASICHGPWTLAAAGVVKGRHLTSISADGVPDDVRAAGGIWEDSGVVVDGNLITSRSPADLPAFLREIARKVSEMT
jgi:protease I